MQGSLNSMVLWLPLTDIDDSLGALQIIPGSHLWGLRSENISDGFGMVDVNEKDDHKFISVPVKAGDVLAFSSFLVHRSGENTTDSPRWSCHFRYNDLMEKTFIERNFAHAYIYKPVEELFSPGFPKQEDLHKLFST
jgi:ectoine hydroxylase-related dioxygenase (phytanoyl-CoA dioxygenase family)